MIPVLSNFLVIPSTFKDVAPEESKTKTGGKKKTTRNIKLSKTKENIDQCCYRLYGKRQILPA